VKFVVKAAIRDTAAKTFALHRQKTMYGGRRINAGDTIYLFASELEGGPGLIARGVVTAAAAVAKKPGVERQTPRVSIRIQRTARAKRRLGRVELKPFSNWTDGRPETELNFKFYRQATNKIGGISDQAARFLDRYFRPTTKARRPRATRPATNPRR
jgi:hypothetical protein